MKKKIFIGTNNIASVFNDFRAGFAELGYETLTVSRFLQPSKIINDYSDFNVQKWINYAPRGRRFWAPLVEKYIFRRAIRECDIFVFISSSFSEDFSDLEILKKHNKKIFFVFVGDDVRWYYAMKQEFLHYGLRPMEYDSPSEITSKTAFDNRIRRIRTAEKYADAIFSRLDQSQLQLRPFYRWNMMVRSSTITENSEQRSDKPVICHAPSNRKVKGTEFVLDALAKLKDEGISFELSLLENVDNEQAIKIYGDADIIVDQLVCPGTGKFATEALASGKVVLANMSYNKYPQKNPVNCPIIDVNPDTIYDVLKEVINNHEFRKSQAQKGRPYVEQNLDVRYFCEKVVRLAHGEHLEFDYYPDFFRNKYIATDDTERDILNDYNTYLNDEEWYCTFVNKGERDELVF